MWTVDNVVEMKKRGCPQLQKAAELLRENEADAFKQTETVYGLGANAMNDSEAITKFLKRKADRVIIR